MRLREKIIKSMGASVEEKVVHVGSVKTHYLTAGKGKTILLLHGNNAAGAVSWYPVIGALATDFKVIAPDVVGYGESDKPFASYGRPYFVLWLKNFLDVLGLEKIDLVGNSQGGSIALQFTHDYPERVDKLVLADSGSLGNELPLGAVWGFIWNNTFPSLFSTRWLNRFLIHNTDKIDKNWTQYSLTLLRKLRSKLVFWLGAGKATRPISKEVLSKIHHKTLIIWGTEEKLFPISHAEKAHRFMPDAKIQLIEGAGHIPFFDQPDRFNNAVQQFLI
ncbi:Pimeloyl-ACP methyl ester carboxylesterase [Desulfocicer vacuolatum DSM 3385]|uniref:Pimeloyl-ACP methyl ester carboxylesterase n=1 Tax=Desulfocicer vacuolatum DSM 3385 TaxID=1121400 RepID=A0A1W2A5K1_9BACT|nr:alpha/beta hydrolase [Desulfocicer vacuolatum]SMC55701.1 Pimeloyl-ACP methyl ester carboxylesterase [Desulfocicer vacuolatum DSM 3385]